MPLLIREKPPLALCVCVQPPEGGPSYRWGSDDPNVQNSPDNLTFATSMPGGFSTFSCTLNRDRRVVSYPDEEEFSMVTVLGMGGRTVAWQGRLEQLPDVAGYQAQVNPQASGWQAHLDDDDSAAMIFVDQDLTNWTGPSLDRQIYLSPGGGGGFEFQLGSNAVAASPSSTAPLINLEVEGAWVSPYLPIAETWYNGGPAGLVGKVYYSFSSPTSGAYSGSWSNILATTANDSGAPATAIASLTSPSSGLVSAGGQYVFVQFYYGTTPAGTQGQNYNVYWQLAVYGNHGLTLQGASPQGLLASDVIGYTVSKWCPKITYTTGTNGTIQASSFIIPQLAFTSPTTSSVIIKQAAQYELLDWAVWELGRGPTAQPAFYLSEFNASPFANQWRARVGPAQLQDNGPNVTRIWNGVIVQFTAVDGTTQTVGPTGSNANTTSASLLDTDPLNPANEAGLRRWALVTMGTSTPAGAIQTGAVFLQAQKQLDTSGQAALQGHVQDSSGNWWPAWAVRAGDQISFVDASDTSLRRIVSTSYDHSTRTNSIQLDQPPDSMSALLERLSVVLSPAGFS